MNDEKVFSQVILLKEMGKEREWEREGMEEEWRGKRKEGEGEEEKYPFSCNVSSKKVDTCF